MSKCSFTSSNPLYHCDRDIYDNNEYCLFHLPNKTGKDADLFWKIINFRYFSDELFRLDNELFSKRINGEDLSLISSQITIEQNRIVLSNFTETEIMRPDFFGYKNKIISLYEESRISGRASASPDFRGFKFPAFEKKFNYQYNPFCDYKIINFSDVIFEGPANFCDFNFIDEVIFSNTKFMNWVVFTRATFYKNCSFLNTDLNTSYGVLGAGMFENTRFLGNDVTFKNVPGRPSFNTIDFSSHTKFNLLNMNFPKDFGQASFGEDAYRVAKNQALSVGNYSMAGEYYYQERIYKRMQMKNSLEKCFDSLMDLTTGYGEKPKNIIIASLIVIILCSFFYYEPNKNYIDQLFYSFIAFTTLGAKTPDILNTTIKIVLSLESFIGGIFMALLVLTLSKKYSR